MTHNLVFSIIIPTRNERNNLEKLLPVLTHLYPQSPVFTVDDNSADDTGAFLKQFCLNHPQVHLISRKNQRGRGSAVIDGLKKAAKDKKISYFLEMDADFSHNPNEIKKLLSKVPQGNALQSKALPYKDLKEPVIIGSRHIPGAKFLHCSPLRVFLSKLANWYIKLILKIPINDYTNGFRLYPKQAVQELINTHIKETGYIVLSETAYILHKKGFKFKEVPTVFVNRKEGRSHATIIEFLRSLPAILRIKLNH